MTCQSVGQIVARLFPDALEAGANGGAVLAFTKPLSATEDHDGNGERPEDGEDCASGGHATG